MTTSAKIGHLAEFSRRAGEGAFGDIAEVVSFNPPQMTRGTVDATNQTSSDGYREFITGLRDSGEVSVELNFVPSDGTQRLLVGDMNRGSVEVLEFDFINDEFFTATETGVEYRMTFPDFSYVQFEGYVNSITAAVPRDDKMMLSAGLKVTGKPVWGVVGA